MACGSAFPNLESLPTTEGSSNKVSEAQFCDKPVKLNVARLQAGVLPPSAKKIAARELFSQGRNVTRPSSICRPSERYKASFIKPKMQVNRRSSVGKVKLPSKRFDSMMFQRKTQGPIAFGSSINPQKIPASTTKKEKCKIPSRFQYQGSSGTTRPSRVAKIGGKVTNNSSHKENLENSVKLLNVDDIEEKLVSESSLLTSQILKQIHKDTGGVSSCNKCSDLTKINEKLDKTLNELADLKEMIKNLALCQDTVCKSSCHHQAVHITERKSNNNSTSGNETNDCVPGSESKSLRRSSRLNNKGAQFAYESLRKSTKLLTTPRHSSAKKINTPGRISRKVIAQLNELYND